MKFLCLSDIHGNADALRAVLREADRRGFERVLVAGDLFYPGPAPLDVWKILTSLNATFVPGLSDHALLKLDLNTIRATTAHERERVERLKAVRGELGELILARLAKVPLIARIPLQNADELILVHGCPRDPTEGISHEMSDEEMTTQLGGDPADVVVCGMTHVPFERHVSGVQIVNAGSVGEAPGGNFAHGTLLKVLSTGYEIEAFEVPLGHSIQRTIP